MRHYHCIAIGRVPSEVLDFLQSIEVCVRVRILAFVFALSLASFAHHLLVKLEEF